MSVAQTITDEWEAHRVALHTELYKEGVGLPYDRQEVERHSQALESLSARRLDSAQSEVESLFALESWAEARQVLFDQRLSDGMDECLVAPALQAGAEPLTWRNWRRFERENDDPELLGSAFDLFVEQSKGYEDRIRERYEAERAAYAARGLTPAQVFAFREHVRPEAVRDLLVRVGEGTRAAFGAALEWMTHRVFGRSAGPAELRALYLNRMYDPYARIAGGSDPMALVRRTYAQLGFDLSAIALDVDERPGKYPGAFCYPIHVPHDVRVSVRVASPHHLLDMLFHEFGHAVHFSGVRPDLPVIDRYWIHSGVHETFSTLFELLLGEPGVLGECLGLDDAAVDQLVEFDRFKALLTSTWTVASGLAAFDAWTEVLDWSGIERRHTEHLLRFTGVGFPPGYSRLSPFVAGVNVYPIGYVMALVRCEHWRRHLRERLGDRWWARSETREALMVWIRPGGAVRFPDEWLDPQPFIERYIGSAGAR